MSQSLAQEFQIPPPSAPAPQLVPPGPMQMPQLAHAAAKAHFEAVQEKLKFQSQATAQMDKLLQLGDRVQPQDVISSAATLVGHGADAKMVAGLLSTMPQSGGEGLAGWLEGHAAKLRSSVAENEQLAALSRAHMGASAMRLLGMFSSGAEGNAENPLAAAGAGSNALSQSPASAGPAGALSGG